MARILLAEDEFLIRTILAEELAESGHSVFEAGSGDEAARLSRNGQDFDLLVTDIQMPGTLDGAELARLIRQRQPLLPVIYVTGRPEALSGVHKLGPRDRLMRKPYSATEIVAMAAHLLSCTAPCADGIPPIPTL